jgi:hypothetical protein
MYLFVFCKVSTVINGTTFTQNAGTVSGTITVQGNTILLTQSTRRKEKEKKKLKLGG